MKFMSNHSVVAVEQISAFKRCLHSARYTLRRGMVAMAVLAAGCISTQSALAAELNAEDFKFDGPLGSHGTTIQKISRNHFKVTLGQAQQHKSWSNKLQFQITKNARGNDLKLDVVYPGGTSMPFNEYFYSWSYDGLQWQPIQWQTKNKDTKIGDSLMFPTFEQDTVYVGHQVPMSHEDVVAMVEGWKRNPHVKVHVIGKSLGGRDIYRIEISDSKSTVARRQRWGHYFSNQHPGEHNSQWRMVGMIDWLLGETGADFRRRSVCHFVLMISPDAPSHGWYRINQQGVDMNRTYRPEGADAKEQAHEAYLAQKDFEQIMASETPITSNWAMHTWGGQVETIVYPGPEMKDTSATGLGPWTRLRDLIEQFDEQDLHKPLGGRTSLGNLSTSWGNAPQRQFGITSFLCEGGGGIFTKEENLASGVVLIKSLAAYYKGSKPDAAPRQ